jgi:hypothetical protein
MVIEKDNIIGMFLRLQIMQQLSIFFSNSAGELHVISLSGGEIKQQLSI